MSVPAVSIELSRVFLKYYPYLFCIRLLLSGIFEYRMINVFLTSPLFSVSHQQPSIFSGTCSAVNNNTSLVASPLSQLPVELHFVLLNSCRTTIFSHGSQTEQEENQIGGSRCILWRQWWQIWSGTAFGQQIVGRWLVTRKTNVRAHERKKAGRIVLYVVMVCCLVGSIPEQDCCSIAIS